mmetsp:Transcript_46960/g.135290  ORF Transcript_46960/g.135290 Transcript_46960/m.135290 type:complete len:243 (+) Transcript_46960:802-1530(+)
MLHRVLLQPNDDDICFRVLASVQNLPIVQQVEQLSTIDLIERDIQAQVAEVLGAQATEQVTRRQQKDARGALDVANAFDLALVRAHHRERLAAASLTIGKASTLRAAEHCVDDRPYGCIVQLLVRHVLVEGLVKQKVVFLHITCEVDLELRFAHNDGAVSADYDVLLRRLQLSPIHRPLPDHHAQPRVALPRNSALRSPRGSTSAARQKKSVATPGSIRPSCPHASSAAADATAGIGALEVE